MTIPNRMTLRDVTSADVATLAALPPDQLRMLAEEAGWAAKAAKGVAAKVNDAIWARYETEANDLRNARD